MKENGHHISFKMKLSIAMMLIPMAIFIILVSFKGTLPTQILVLIISSLFIGSLLLIKETVGFSSLYQELKDDLEKTLNTFSKKIV